MKKAEELKLYAPEPKRPELDAALSMSVAEGQGVGRYIKGKVLTVAVWDKKEILSVNGVHEITSFELSRDTKSRILSCKFEVNSTEGEIESEVNLKIG